jgi:Domain of unknown function (DUF4347)
MAVEVKVVQDPGDKFFRDLFTWDGNMPLWADKFFKDATPIKTVDDFVRTCTDTQKAKGLIDYIQINGHGNDTGFRLGNEWIDLKTIEGFKPKLALVASMLTKNCSVEISACEAGKAVELVRKFSHILGGVTIVGYLVSQQGGLAPTSPPVIITPGGKPFTSPAPASGGFSQPNPPPPR